MAVSRGHWRLSASHWKFQRKISESKGELTARRPSSSRCAAVGQVNTTANGFYWDITLAAQQHEGGDFSVCVKEKNQPSAGNWAKFHSAETSTGGAQPFLEVQYNPPDDDNSDAQVWVAFDAGCLLECVIWPEPGELIESNLVLDNAGAGMSGIAAGPRATDDDVQWTEGLFATFGDFSMSTNPLTKNVRVARAHGFDRLEVSLGGGHRKCLGQ